jgi:hypothetical protein
MSTIRIKAWTDDYEHTQDEDWYTFAKMYPATAEWLRNVEASIAGEERSVLWTLGYTRLRHLGRHDDDANMRSLCGARSRGRWNELKKETWMSVDRPYRICPKCKRIAKAENATAKEGG